MSFQLNDIEVRVLGALVEKDMATPEYYPLSLNALVNACNQKSNRDPVVSYDEEAVEEAVETLRAKNLAMVTTGGEHRVPKYSHRISETLNLGNRELAVLCVLMLRGPQTAGELKGRTQRLQAFDDLGGVESCLNRLMGREQEPLVVRLPRQPGAREHRYAHLLSGEVQVLEQEPPGQPQAAAARPDPVLERVARLEAELDSLKQDLLDLERQFADFRRQFE